MSQFPSSLNPAETEARVIGFSPWLDSMQYTLLFSQNAETNKSRGMLTLN